MMRHHLKYLGFKFHWNRLNRSDTRRDYVFCNLPIPNCVSLIMVTITSHIFINIFQMAHFSAVKFNRCNEKNMSFLLIPKSPKVWEKSEAVGPGTFNTKLSVYLMIGDWIPICEYDGVCLSHILCHAWHFWHIFKMLYRICQSLVCCCDINTSHFSILTFST